MDFCYMLNTKTHQGLTSVLQQIQKKVGEKYILCQWTVKHTVLHSSQFVVKKHFNIIPNCT